MGKVMCQDVKITSCIYRRGSHPPPLRIFVNMRSPRTHALWTDLNYPHFITSTTYRRQNFFTDVACASAVIDELRWYEHAYKVTVIAAVVMPDHLHVIIWPQGTRTFSDFMRSVKSRCANRVGEIMTRRGMGPPPIGDTTIAWIEDRTERAIGAENIGTVENATDDKNDHDRRGSHPPPNESEKRFVPKIWQDSFFDYVITTEEKLAEKIWYIIRNPVEDNLVADGGVYPYLFVHQDFDPRS